MGEIKATTVYTLSGIMVILVLAIGSIICILLNPSWDIMVNSFSDLGDTDSPSRYLFDAVCVIAGIFISIFSIGFLRYGKKLTKVGGGVMILAGFMMVLVGIVSKEFSFDGHLLVSKIFAFTFAVGAALTCLQDAIDRNWKDLLPAVIGGLMVAGIWIAYLLLGEENVRYGLAQTVSFAGAFLWFVYANMRARKLYAEVGTDVTA